MLIQLITLNVSVDSFIHPFTWHERRFDVSREAVTVIIALVAIICIFLINSGELLLLN